MNTVEAALVYGEGVDRERRIELTNAYGNNKKEGGNGAAAHTKAGHFRYADSTDVLLMLIGTFGAAGNGILITLFSLFFGDLVDSFAGEQIVIGNDIDSKGIEDSVNRIAYRFAALTGAGFIAAYLEVSFWSIAGHRQARKAREHFMKSLMRRDMTYFDCHEAGAVTTNSVRATQEMQRALGEKVGSVVHFTCTFLSSVALGFYLGWQLSLLILGCVPLLAASIIFLEMTQKRASKLKADAYGDAGTIAEQCLSSIRTIKQSGGEAVETDRYNMALQGAESAAIRGGVYAGCGFGVMSGTILAFFGLSLWFGGWLIARGETNSSNGSTWSAGDVVAVLFAQILGAMALGQIQPPMSAVLQGRIASRTVAEETSIISEIDPLADQSHVGPHCMHSQAHAELRSVWFNYPSRPDVPILRGLSLSIPAGKTAALVGESGCGKSTVIQLLLRFYDPADGTVLLDGIDIKSVGVTWLRRQIGLVSQEPVLFATTIAENIKFGKCYEAASDSEIIDAATAANAHDFISRLPKGYDTLCGERGAQLSGGQKQRIAIARALVRKPRMLLLDEATSALDVKSERVVQEALDSARQGRTTLVIAHRLSTIRNADLIMSLRNGVVVESGSHGQLIEQGGIYAEMVHRQTISTGNVQESNTALVPCNEPAAVENAGGSNESIRNRLESTCSLGDSQLSLDQAKVKYREMSPMAPTGSADSPHDGNQKSDVDSEGSHRPSYLKLFAESWPEAHWALLGTIFAGAYGAEYPIFSLLFGRAIGELQAAKGRGEVTGAVGILAGSMFAVGVACGFCVFCQNACFAMVGERLTTRLRYKSFWSLVRRRVPFFDDPRNGSALLCSRLATEAAEVRGAAAERLGLVAQNLLTAFLGAGIALASSWKLGLVTLACVPLMTVGSLIENKLYRGGFEEIGSDEAGELLGQAVQNARTVAAYGLETSLLEEASKRLDRVMSMGIRLAHGSGIAYGFSQGIQYAIYGLGFWYGGRLLKDGEWDHPAADNAAECATLIEAGVYANEHVCSAAINFSYGFGRFMEAFFAVLLACWGVGEALSFAPDAAKALDASAKIFRMIESTPDEMENPDWQSNNDEGTCVSNKENSSSLSVPCIGQIEFNDIIFRYPSRPEVQVLRGLSLHVPTGKTVALVGESGCGKSTLIQLVLRFYDPDSGAVVVDGTNIKDIGVAWLRRQIGLVAQEPVLFGTTVRANIAYGRLWDPPTAEEVELAAKAANAHEFLSKLPQGYDTLCGERGAQLSGGQKQRIAIARALVRKPRMLLLDEATSALDTASERVVQEALDSARQGRTTLVIAHRLSTVRDADIIAAIKDGVIAETGSHDELSVRPDSVYASLLRASGIAAKGEAAESIDSAWPDDAVAVVQP